MKEYKISEKNGPMTVKYGGKKIYDESKIGRRIRELRTNKKISQIILANYIGYDSRTVRKFEKGQSIPPLGTMLRLCNFLECELGYLLGEFDQRTRSATDIQRETGLSENAINKLKELKELDDMRLRNHALRVKLAESAQEDADTFDMTRKPFITADLLSYIIESDKFRILRGTIEARINHVEDDKRFDPSFQSKDDLNNHENLRIAIELEKIISDYIEHAANERIACR